MPITIELTNEQIKQIAAHIMKEWIGDKDTKPAVFAPLHYNPDNSSVYRPDASEKNI